jgi:hypothetical protein
MKCWARSARRDSLRRPRVHLLLALLGEYELFDTRRNFEARMIDFTNHLHARYLLSIEPKSPHPGLHQLRVRLRDADNKTVLARSSYWAGGTME